MTTNFDNLDETNQLFERHDVPNSHKKKKKKDNLNRPIIIKEIESVTNNLSKKKKNHQAQKHSLVNFTKHLRKEIIQIFYNLF